MAALGSQLTLGGDGQYCVVVRVAALAHRVEGVDGEVVGGGRLQAGDGEEGLSRRNDVHVAEAERLSPAVPSQQQAGGATRSHRPGLTLEMVPWRLTFLPDAKPLRQPSVEAGDPLQSDRVVAAAHFPKRRGRIGMTWGRREAE